MSSFALPSVLSALVALTLGWFVAAHRDGSAVRKCFSFMCFQTLNWQLCWFASYFLYSEAGRQLIVKLAFSSIVFLPFTYYHFIVLYLKQWDRWRSMVIGLYLFALIFLGLLWLSDIFISGYYKFGWGIYGKAGVLHPVYVIVTAFAIVHMGLLQCRVGIRNFKSKEIRFCCFSAICFISGRVPNQLWKSILSNWCILYSVVFCYYCLRNC
jgi:hypothetical protein